jgi:PhoH-like ATPase
MSPLKSYVLDTSVLIHDPDSFTAFQEHNVIIGSAVVRELDGLKSGYTDTARTARRVSWTLDQLISQVNDVRTPIPLRSGGRLQFMETGPGPADHELLTLTAANDAVLVTNDTNLRLLAAFQGIKAEAYRNDQIDCKALEGIESYGTVGPWTKDVFGVRPLNEEQALALGMLMDLEKSLVILKGVAGTGKTLLTMAMGLQYSFEEKLMDDIIFTRELVESGEKIGFLPGTEEEKMSPWLQQVEDALDLMVPEPMHNLAQKAGRDMLIRRKIKLRSFGMMRGRTFARRVVAVDEAQNLTPAQIKMITTRMGENSKLVLMGDDTQIDNRFISKNNCGINYAAVEFQNCPYAGFIALKQGNRSPLATWAAEHLD